MTIQKNTPANSPGKNSGPVKEVNAGQKTPVPGQGKQDREKDKEKTQQDEVYREKGEDNNRNTGADQGIGFKTKSQINDPINPNKEKEVEVNPQRIDPEKTEENPGKQRERERNAESDPK